MDILKFTTTSIIVVVLSRMKVLLFHLGLLLGLLTSFCNCKTPKDCYGASVSVFNIAKIGNYSSTKKICPLSECSQVEIRVYNGDLATTLYGLPAAFGRPIQANVSEPMQVVSVEPANACSSLHVPVSGHYGNAAIVERGNCTFDEKVANVQKAGLSAMIIYDPLSDDGCLFMGGNSTDNVYAVSVTHKAGVTLLNGLKSTATITLRSPPLSGWDVSLFALWIIAVGSIAVGSLWSGSSFLKKKQGKRSARGDVEVVAIDTKAAASFIVVASAGLLLMFFLLSKWLALVLVALFALASWQAGTHVIYSAAEALVPAFKSVSVRVSEDWTIKALDMLSSALAALLAITWLIFRKEQWSWILQDALSIGLILSVLQSLRLPNLKVASVLLPLAFVYDIWWVFLQPLVTGGPSVMVQVATGVGAGERLPMLLEFPQLNGLGTNPRLSLLGLGDVVLPGLLVVLTRSFDISKQLPPLRSYFATSLTGYSVGLVLTYVALAHSWFGNQGQPALLYLVPCTLGAVAVSSYWKGHFWMLWDFDSEGCPRYGSDDVEAGNDWSEAAVEDALLP